MFYRNTVDISEISENHLEAIIGGRQVAERVGVRRSAVERGQNATGRIKSVQDRRTWHLAGVSANYIDLQNMGASRLAPDSGPGFRSGPDSGLARIPVGPGFRSVCTRIPLREGGGIRPRVPSHDILASPPI
jgi:hypothetical protein